MHIIQWFFVRSPLSIPFCCFFFIIINFFILFCSHSFLFFQFLDYVFGFFAIFCVFFVFVDSEGFAKYYKLFVVNIFNSFFSFVMLLLLYYIWQQIETCNNAFDSVIFISVYILYHFFKHWHSHSIEWRILTAKLYLLLFHTMSSVVCLL